MSSILDACVVANAGQLARELLRRNLPGQRSKTAIEKLRKARRER